MAIWYYGFALAPFLIISIGGLISLIILLSLFIWYLAIISPILLLVMIGLVLPTPILVWIMKNTDLLYFDSGFERVSYWKLLFNTGLVLWLAALLVIGSIQISQLANRKAELHYSVLKGD